MEKCGKQNFLFPIKRNYAQYLHVHVELVGECMVWLNDELFVNPSSSKSFHSIFKI